MRTDGPRTPHSSNMHAAQLTTDAGQRLRREALSKPRPPVAQ